MRRRKRNRRLKLILAVTTILGASALTMGVTKGYAFLEEKNVFKGTHNVISDIYCWINECYETGYINNLERRYFRKK